MHEPPSPSPYSTTPSARPARTALTLRGVGVEFLAHRDNLLFIGLLLGVGAWVMLAGADLRHLAWFVVGLAVFVPQEYFTHVWVLHAPMPTSRRLYFWIYRLHYGHHDVPKRHDLMYMPLWLTVPMMLGNLALMWLITPEPLAFASAYCGALAGYIGFEWSHLLCHVPYTPKSQIWRHARTQHMLHHFYDEKQWYAVTPGLEWIDYAMGTCPERTARPRSSTCRYLGLGEGHAWLLQARARFAARSSGDATSSRLWNLGPLSREASDVE